MRLSLEEAIAVRFHMGGFTASPADQNVSAAFEKVPLAVLLHIADLEASYLDEVRG